MAALSDRQDQALDSLTYILRTFWKAREHWQATLDQWPSFVREACSIEKHVVLKILEYRQATLDQ